MTFINKKYNVPPSWGIIMSEKGSIFFRKTKSSGHYGVAWYIGKKKYRITRYKGLMCETESMAKRLLSLMRSDEENGTFNIEKYLYQATDVIPFLEEWIKNQPHLSPATLKDYQNSINNHLIPWFKEHPLLNLQDLQYDKLCELLRDIKRSGKGKMNVMYCLHTALLDARRSGKITTMPEFPQKKKYGIEPTVIKAIPEARQINIIESIPIEHQPIFWWLKYHYRRPSEAMALHKVDYDKAKDIFIIRRSFSNKQLVQHTKTHHIHVIPCHPDFKPWLDKMHKSFGDYLFTHETSRMEGQRYQHDFLVDLWNKAASSQGENIRMYAGLKHSSCSAFVNEQGGSIDELQMLTDHARRDSVLKYTEVKIEAKRRIQAKIIRIGAQQAHAKNSK